ncbi:MAG: hypothetical protein HYU66_03345 [Armatimonadetes bacterium]|nr:hypothetical protein [Armatimonadota bacterium]
MRVDFELLAEGALPERWRALPGSDQTVETLPVAAGGAGGSRRCLRWTPTGGDSGVLGLPFAPSSSVEVSLQLRLTAPPAGERLIVLAPAPLLPPLGGVALASDGTVRGSPRGASLPVAVGGWTTLVLRVNKGRLEALWDGSAVTPAGGLPVERGAGALVLAKPAGADAVTIELDDIQIGPPGGTR